MLRGFRLMLRLLIIQTLARQRGRLQALSLLRLQLWDSRGNRKFGDQSLFESLRFLLRKLVTVAQLSWRKTAAQGVKGWAIPLVIRLI